MKARRQGQNAISTRKAYGSVFRIFGALCDGKGVASLPAAPQTVAAFLAAQAGSGTKPSMIGRRVAAIRYAHKLAGVSTPPMTKRSRPPSAGSAEPTERQRFGSPLLSRPKCWPWWSRHPAA
jgi:hypothetical protein